MNVADICKVAPQSANVDKMASNTVVFDILVVNILLVSLLKCLLNYSENVHRTTIYNLIQNQKRYFLTVYVLWP